MSVREVLCQIEAAGIALRLDGGKIRIRYQEPKQREKLAGEVAMLRAHRDEVAEVLRARDDRDGAPRPSRSMKDENGEHRDYYDWRAHVALDAICRVPAPEGLIVWLDGHSPFTYRILTKDLPNRISCAWDARIPHDRFDELCLELVDLFRFAAQLYSSSTQTPGQAGRVNSPKDNSERKVDR